MNNSVLTSLFLILIAISVNANAQNEQSLMNKNHGHHRSAITATPIDGSQKLAIDFDLINVNGNTVTMKDFLGHYVLLGFGFTHCEVVCPTMTASIAKVINTSKKSVRGIFISVDSERDSPETTQHYAQSFNKNITGLTGSYTQIVNAAKNFHASFVVTKSHKSYTVQHTASIYLIDPQGKLLDVFAINASTEAIITAMD